MKADESISVAISVHFYPPPNPTRQLCLLLLLAAALVLIQQLLHQAIFPELFQFINANIQKNHTSKCLSGAEISNRRSMVDLCLQTVARDGNCQNLQSKYQVLFPCNIRHSLNPEVHLNNTFKLFQSHKILHHGFFTMTNKLPFFGKQTLFTIRVTRITQICCSQDTLYSRFADNSCKGYSKL
jgi:hypothetical protein